MSRWLRLAIWVAVTTTAVAHRAMADTVTLYTTGVENPGFSVGPVVGQDGWTVQGDPNDAVVVSLTPYHHAIPTSTSVTTNCSGSGWTTSDWPSRGVHPLENMPDYNWETTNTVSTKSLML